jgi:hypothetical protein
LCLRHLASLCCRYSLELVRGADHISNIGKNAIRVLLFLVALWRTRR